MDKFLIKYHKWTKDDSKHFHRSCRALLSYGPPNSITQSIHFIFIITIHGSKHRIDLKRKYYLKIKSHRQIQINTIIQIKSLIAMYSTLIQWNFKKKKPL